LHDRASLAANSTTTSPNPKGADDAPRR
jgi:hypothetical protein